MEFFKEIHSPGLDLVQLKKLLTIENLTRLCASISDITASRENEGDIYCIWGEFNIRREELTHGIRFSLPGCPHAFAWTITFDEADEAVIIHCTTNKKELDPDFVDSIHTFVEDWSKGIINTLE